MERSDDLNELAAALSKVQGALQPAPENAVNPHFRSKYADLTGVWDTCRKLLSENGLSVVQTFEPSDGTVLFLTTTLLHSSGQWMAGTSSFPVGKQDAQGYAGASTYARRYGLAAIVGICTADDDGNEAAGREQQQRRRPEQTRQSNAPPPTPATPKQVPPRSEAWPDGETLPAESAGDRNALKLRPENQETVLTKLRADIVALLDPAKKAGADPNKLKYAGQWAKSAELTVEKAEQVVRGLQRDIEAAEGVTS